MIDREQKGILKDLIISGQDNELQHALDMYEEGDISKLESMIQNGMLSNRAMTDIDLLGDLDLDFLNVSGDQNGNGHRLTDASNQPLHPPPSHSTRVHTQQIPEGASLGEASDGIGELDFDGGIDGSVGFEPIQSFARAPSPVYHSYGPRSRSNSTFSIDNDIRNRSNSLFSALIGSGPQEGAPPPDYGRWMERSSDESQTTEASRFEKTMRRASAPNLPTSSSTKPSSIQNKRSSSSSSKPKLGATKREIRAEEKRRERQEKKENKAREKQEKREKREQAKLDKQKKAEIDDKEEHQPGSGRPRSMSDPNLRSSFDINGLLHIDRPDGWIGAYSPESRKVRIARYLEKRNHRVWTKTVKYDVRKNFADSRLRVKGRFVKKEDELLMRELMSLT
jgi:flagellar biosynthesis GTPase FlhF